MSSKSFPHLCAASIAAAVGAALFMAGLPSAIGVEIGGSQSGGAETAQSGGISTPVRKTTPRPEEHTPGGRNSDEGGLEESTLEEDATDPSSAGTNFLDLPVGGPLALPVIPFAAAAAASSLPSADPHPEYLMPVEPGASLGRNGRYSEYLWNEAVPWNWASPQCSSVTPEGSNLRLVSACTAGKLVTTVLDPSTKAVVSRKEISLSGALPLVGAVGKMSDGNIYLVTGQQNPNEDDKLEVIRVQKYDTSLNLLGKTGIASGGVRGPSNGVVTPFYAASSRMTMVGNTLYLHSSKLIYKSSDGLNHQTNLTLELNAKDMSGMKQRYDYGAYASHSFNQFIEPYNSALLLVDHGDAYPRTIRLVSLNPKTGATTPYTLLNLQGQIGANRTHATVNGLEIAGTAVAVVGIAAPHDKAVQGVKGTPENKAGQVTSNVYFSAVDLTTKKQTFAWITNNHPTTSNTIVGQPTITALPSGNFAILYGTTDPSTYARSLHYRLVSPAGKVLESKSVQGLAYLPIADPVIVSDTLYWISIPQRAVSPLDNNKWNTEHYLSGLEIVEPITQSPPPVVSAAPALKSFAKAPAPTISGTLKVGSKLTASTGTWSPKPSSYTYQWYRNGAAIKGATSKTYRAAAKDHGKDLHVVVTGKLKGYSNKARASKHVSVRAKYVSAATLSGTAKVGATLTVRPAQWSPAPKSYSCQWYRSGKAIKGATGKTYKVKASDKGKKLSAQVRYVWAVKGGSEKSSYFTNAKKIVNGFSKTPKPKISGTAKVGKTLAAKPGTWSPKPTTYKYQWYRNGKAIKGATSKTYKIKSADKGKKITVKVSAYRAGYASEGKTSSAKKVS